MLDAWARIYGSCSAQSLAILFAWDYSSAFPSLSHSFMFAVFQRNGMPRGFLNLARALYTSVFAFSASRGSLAFLFFVFSGVLQGCPFFAMASRASAFFLS